MEGVRRGQGVARRPKVKSACASRLPAGGARLRSVGVLFGVGIQQV